MKTSSGSKKEGAAREPQGGAPAVPSRDALRSGTRLRGPRGAEEEAPRVGFTDTYWQYKRWVLKAFQSRGLENDAEDLCQKVFERYHRRFGAAGAPYPAAVLSGMIDDAILNHRRDVSRRRIDGEPADDTPPISRSDPELLCIRAEDAAQERERFEAIFAELEPAAREVLTLVEIDGLSREGAAAVFGCSTGALDSRLHRARNKFVEVGQRLARLL